MTTPDDGTEYVTVTEVPSVTGRARELGLTLPEDVVALPNFFFGEPVENMRYVATTLDVKALLKGEGINLNLIRPDGAKIPYSDDRFDTWIGPAIFFGAITLAQKPEVLSQVLDAVWRYVNHLFSASVGLKKAKLSYTVESPDGKTHKIDFDGPVDQLPKIEKLIRAMLPPKPKKIED